MFEHHLKVIRSQFNEVPFFTRNQLLELYLQYEPNLNESTFTWRIYNLKQKGIIREIHRGVYSLSIKNDFVPDLSDRLVKLSRMVAKDYDVDYCITTTEWFNYFSRHQLFRFYYVLEVERDFVENIFNSYSDIKNLRVLIEPNKEVMDRYLELDNTIIIKSLTSRSPKQEIVLGKKKINVPTIEKLLVDMFCDEIIYYPVRGGEMKIIFENAIRNYNINYTRLMSYASRRAQEGQLREYLTSKFDDLLNDIL